MAEASLLGVMQSFAAQMAVFQAMLLAATAVHKTLRRTRSLAAMRQFAGVPAVYAAAALGAATASELAAAALLAMPAQRAAGAVLAALIWSLYGGLIIRAIVQDRRDVDCGCSFGPASSPLGSFQVARNLALTALAVFIACVPSGGAVTEVATEYLGGLALLVLYGALDQVMALRPLRQGEAA